MGNTIPHLLIPVNVHYIQEKNNKIWQLFIGVFTPRFGINLGDKHECVFISIKLLRSLNVFKNLFIIFGLTIFNPRSH
jgi:hypothetical protein